MRSTSSTVPPPPTVRQGSVSGVDELEELPLRVRRQPGELASDRLLDGQRRDHVLGARVHVAEELLDLARAQPGGPRGGVDELRDLVRGPRDVDGPEADARVLVDRGGLAP